MLQVIHVFAPKTRCNTWLSLTWTKYSVRITLFGRLTSFISSCEKCGSSTNLLLLTHSAYSLQVFKQRLTAATTKSLMIFSQSRSGVFMMLDLPEKHTVTVSEIVEVLCFCSPRARAKGSVGFS